MLQQHQPLPPSGAQASSHTLPASAAAHPVAAQMGCVQQQKFVQAPCVIWSGVKGSATRQFLAVTRPALLLTRPQEAKSSAWQHIIRIGWAHTLVTAPQSTCTAAA